MSLSDCLPSKEYGDSGSRAVRCQGWPNGTFANQSELTPSVNKSLSEDGLWDNSTEVHTCSPLLFYLVLGVCSRTWACSRDDNHLLLVGIYSYQYAANERLHNCDVMITRENFKNSESTITRVTRG